MKSLKSKRAFEIQFNWLFVLVAGAAILIFFSLVVIKQRDVAQTSAQASVMKTVESIINGAGASQDTFTNPSIPESRIELSCNRIAIGPVSKQYENLVLFTPSTIKGKRLITQTESLDIPFRATDLLYITSPQIRYIFVGHEDALKLNASLPELMKKEHYDSTPSNLRNQNDDKVKFVIFDGKPLPPIGAFNKMRDEDVTAVRVNPNNELEFYQKRGSSFQLFGKSPYIDFSTIIAATYADTKGIYDCNLKNALRRANLVSKIYLERATKLSDRVTGECQTFYTDAITTLNEIEASTKVLSVDAASKIEQSSADLRTHNLGIQQYSCTLIY